MDTIRYSTMEVGMELTIAVGYLAGVGEHDREFAQELRQCLAKVNEVLEENDLPVHAEPETLPLLNDRSLSGNLSYSSVHYLRRFVAHAANHVRWQPGSFPEEEDPEDDLLVAIEWAQGRSHVICHADCEGFYLPIDFSRPIFAATDRVPGGVLGSSQAVLRELAGVAPLLGIHLVGGTLPDAEADRINGMIAAQGTFSIEQDVWMTLFEAARLSIEHKAAVCFS